MLALDCDASRALADGRPHWRFAFVPVVARKSSTPMMQSSSRPATMAPVPVPFVEILAVFLTGWPLGVASPLSRASAVTGGSCGRLAELERDRCRAEANAKTRSQT